MIDRSSRLFKTYTDLAMGAVEQRDRQKFVKSNRYNIWIKAKALIITI